MKAAFRTPGADEGVVLAGLVGRGEVVGGCGLLSPFLDARSNSCDDVEHLHLLLARDLRLRRCNAVAQHDATERAGDGNGLGAGSDGFFSTFLVDALADRLFHPHARATSAAAEAAVRVAWHLFEVGAGGLDELARRCVHLVVATEVARVVVRDALGRPVSAA